MVAVFVNGNPETAAVWQPLFHRLRRSDTVTLSPPGFGSSISADFPCTVTGYREWLTHELEAIDEPVDLVGHDVGGSTVLTVAMTRPDLIRTWASDSIGVFDPDYVWHDLARTWQTPDEGEASVADLLSGTIKQRAARLAAQGMPLAVAEQIAPAQGPQMGQAILTFYRSAAQPTMARLGRDLHHAAARPGLIILGTDDHFVGSEQMRRRAAARTGAQVAVLEDVGHWWMAQAPEASAEALERFWTANSQPPVAQTCC